ncbi:peptidoglycan recognition protein family protein [Alkalicoccus luteus]|uniref:Autolysin n=1 Tax=Alkalicoccus luteus TaxID=1237094 RepID=A0A969PRK6_9BACI|nr:N-acetylmuramoyl-L-alanine amidase [Alkalicoccus luteus]NJP36678.1 N-acetylmuramoyl-L-alanine amidase [Alkalicoccus luteus]
MEFKRVRLMKHPVKTYSGGFVPNRITIHHSGTEGGSAAAFARYHVETSGWPGIGYHFVIERSGEIVQCHDETVRSFHVAGHNTGNIGICLTGNGSFTALQMQQLKKLVQFLQQKWNIKAAHVRGHRELPHQRTQCPGFSVSELRRELQGVATVRYGSSGAAVIRLQNALLKAGYKLREFGADGVFGRETEAAVIQFQRDQGIQTDGIAGPVTWGRLIKSTTA